VKTQCFFLELIKVKVLETGVNKRIKCTVVSSKLQDGGLPAK
jgi:hypothetical protein